MSLKIPNYLTIERGWESWVDYHYTNYWKVRFNLSRKHIYHEIATYDNGLSSSKKYHCYISHTGCIRDFEFHTDNFKEAVNFMIEKLNKFIIWKQV